MDPAWVGVVGALTGGLVGVLGTWLSAQHSRSESIRSERRAAYADFLEHANRGIRSVETLRRYNHRIEAAQGLPLEARTDAELPATESLTELRAEVNDFINGMDRSLVAVQLLAPLRLLESARHLHDGIYYFEDDHITSDDLSDRFRSFVALAHADLRFRWPARVGLGLGRTSGIPLRRAAQTSDVAVDEST